jgi:hypothetical protein
MDEIVKVKIMYLDNLLKQLINYQDFKGEEFSDDVPEITKKLLTDLQDIINEFTEQFTTNSTGTIGEKFFNNQAIKSEFEGDWKLLRHLENLEFIKHKIIEECASDIPKELLSEKSDGFLMSLDQVNYAESLMQRYSQTSVDSTINGEKLPEKFILKTFDYDLENSDKENRNLRATYFITTQLGDLQNDMEVNLDMARTTLQKANTEVEEAAKESEDVVKEVKKKVKSKWNWLPFQLGALVGVAGGASGAIFGSLPGLAIGSSAGTAGGVAVGAVVSTTMNSNMDDITAEFPHILNQ